MKNRAANGHSKHLQHKAILDQVNESISDEKLLSSDLLNDEPAPGTFGEELADKVAGVAGSWTFILSFTGVLLIWILVNVYVFMNRGFDPYPFILLNLVLSCVAALQAPFIMMSQNRQEIIDRKRARNDYIINLKAEIEIRGLHRKIDELVKEIRSQKK